MDARVAFVAKHWKDSLVDVGIGSGAFIETRARVGRRQTFGYDVCPTAVAWLRERELLANPYIEGASAVSLWDVLEHIQDFQVLLAEVKKWVFVSIPIFRDCEHVLRSKHYRKDEHVWYFTSRGLIETMKSLGFECAEENDMETRIGREDIGTFAFRRG